jgi:hypothetical protein
LIAIEEPKNSADKEEHDLIERPWHWRESERATPPNRAWDAAVSNDDLDGVKGSGDEGTRGSHAASLGRERLSAARPGPAQG